MPKPRKHSYTRDQKRAAEYIVETTIGSIGGGDDPVGFLINSHRMLVRRVANLRAGKPEDDQ